MHRYHLCHGQDADYIVLEELTITGWVEHTRWMIPGSWLED